MKHWSLKTNGNVVINKLIYRLAKENGHDIFEEIYLNNPIHTFYYMGGRIESLWGDTHSEDMLISLEKAICILSDTSPKWQLGSYLAEIQEDGSLKAGCITVYPKIIEEIYQESKRVLNEKVSN